MRDPRRESPSEVLRLEGAFRFTELLSQILSGYLLPTTNRRPDRRYRPSHTMRSAELQELTVLTLVQAGRPASSRARSKAKHRTTSHELITRKEKAVPGKREGSPSCTTA